MFAALEDNQVQLSTMKASRFVKAFEQEVDKWERTLSHILEVVEMLLTVQRQWMYLEVRIFELRHEKTCLWGFQLGPTQTSRCTAKEDAQRLEGRGIVLSMK